jgi:hypothetical protein
MMPDSTGNSGRAWHLRALWSGQYSAGYHRSWDAKGGPRLSGENPLPAETGRQGNHPPGEEGCSGLGAS